MLQRPLKYRHKPEMGDNWKHKLQIYIDREHENSRESVDRSVVNRGQKTNLSVHRQRLRLNVSGLNGTALMGARVGG